MNIKNVLILGDSYSTFKGHIPDGYAHYYAEDRNDEADVRRVEDTWWHKLCSELNLNLTLNNSWSGSTVGYRGYGNADCSHTSSFISRLEKLYKNGFFEENKIDTVLIFGATNDSWANVELKEEKYSDFKEDDLFFVLPAISYLIKRLKEILPDGNIIYLINTDLKPEICTAVKNASVHYNTHFIEFSDIDKINGHPSIKGMNSIKNQVKKFILEN